MSEEAPLKTLLAKVIDNRGRTCPTADDGMPLIATNCVHNTGLYPTFEKIRHVDEETYQGWFRGHPEPGDLIFVLKGTPGRVCLTPDPVTFCIAQDMVALRADPAKVEPSYLFAALRSPQIQAAIGNLHVGSMIAHFKKGDFDRLMIPLPEKSTQKGIGDFYLEVSKKIELNRRMSATLEEMARALYRSWFVDFDPVHARAAGLSPAHMTPTTAALFPDSFGPDGLPKGWTEEPIIEQSDWVNGAAYKNMHFARTPGALPVVKIAELKAGVTGNTKYTATDLGNKFRIGRGDLLFSWSGNPDTSIDAFIWALGDAWLNQHIFAVRPNGKLSKAVLFSMLKFYMPEFAEIARNKQTTGLGHITRKDLEAFPVRIAPSEVLAVFEEEIEPLFERYCLTLYETQTLATLRDSLLPRLMSGDLRIREVVKKVEEVV
ncbi:restriction endonuclease subunit S [Sulfitobacter pontiacus]|uniref:restriction endonuclease subunit S n=1 Tax=Sulfitobacter pontiacus TaxID=60137 RepID=UPI0036DDED6F